jgi:hypothetical protein
MMAADGTTAQQPPESGHAQCPDTSHPAGELIHPEAGFTEIKPV